MLFRTENARSWSTAFSEYRYEEDAAPMIAPFDQTLTVGIYGDFEINIAKLLEEAGIK